MIQKFFSFSVRTCASRTILLAPILNPIPASPVSLLWYIFMTYSQYRACVLARENTRAHVWAVYIYVSIHAHRPRAQLEAKFSIFYARDCETCPTAIVFASWEREES